MIKSIISTGQGRLHLIESASAIKKAGAEVKVVTGWVPSRKLPDNFINFIGRIAGRKNIAYGLRKRQPKELETNEVYSCSFSEFLIQFLFLLSKLNLIYRDQATVFGWRLFGWQTSNRLRNADIFHVRSGAGQGGAIKKAKKLGMKIVVDHSIAHPNEVLKQLLKANGDKFENFSITPKSKFWQLVLKDCNHADIIQVNSDYVKKSFIQNGYDQDKIQVIPLGVRMDFMGLKKTYQDSGKIKLLFTGGFGMRKGAYLIIKTVEELIKNEAKFQLDIIGSINNDIDLPSWFKNNNNITIHGFIPQDNLKKYLSSADIYIFPSYSEGAAQSLKEAMAAGLPVIATVQSGGPIIHADNGWLIPDDSSDALTESIVKLSQDRELRERLGKQAHRTIITDHTWEKYGEKVTKLYESLLITKNEPKKSA